MEWDGIRWHRMGWHERNRMRCVGMGCVGRVIGSDGIGWEGTLGVREVIVGCNRSVQWCIVPHLLQ